MHILQAVDLQGALDVCIQYLMLDFSRIDLFSGTLTTGVQTGCPRHHCLLATSFTGTASDSYIEFNGTSRAEELYFRVQLEFQTRCARVIKSPYFKLYDRVTLNAI